MTIKKCMENIDIEKRLNAILSLAVRNNASDIHFAQKYEQTDISMRINNTMRRVKSKVGDDKLIRYLQYRSNVDLGSLNPQTGQFEVLYGDNILSLRFAVINTYNATNGVLRILNSNLKVEADKLSKLKSQNEYFKKLLKQDNGLVLFSGATGSGKTTTLYSLLKSVDGSIIYTIEDPIEVVNDKFVQLQINERIGFDYEAGIKQIMRHDPDIIMVGEIRDDKAAKMALRAANTGHLVLSTIHASSVASTIDRMVDLGVSEEYLYEMLICLVHQKMIINRSGEKVVIYEVMDKDEIEYYRRFKKHSDTFLSIDKQIKEGIENGIY